MLSCIVPVYKAEKYLSRCIESVLSQTYQDFELILVDDGSPDDSSTICDNYSTNYNRIKVIHKSNGGVSSARNEGLKAATGEWVCFLDSDDWIENDCFKLLLESAEKNNADLVVCGIKMGDKDGYSESFSTESNFSISSRENWLSCFSEYRKRNDRYICLHSPCGKLYKKSILEGLSFDSSMKYAEDYKFNLDVYGRISNVAFIKDTLYFYFSNPDSVTNSFNILSIVNHFQTVDLTYIFFRNNTLPLISADFYAYTILKNSIFSIFIHYAKKQEFEKSSFSIIKPYLRWKTIFIGKSDVKEFLVLALCKLRMYAVVKLLSKVYLSGK